jgi:hypothetical protein
METRFRAGDLPRDVRQVQLTDPDGPENVVRPLALNEWHAAHIVLERPSPGLHGIRWTWR